MAAGDGLAGGGGPGVRGEDGSEGAAGGVVGGDVVVGERGGWSSRGVDGRAGGRVQRGGTDGASRAALNR